MDGRTHRRTTRKHNTAAAHIGGERRHKNQDCMKVVGRIEDYDETGLISYSSSTANVSVIATRADHWREFRSERRAAGAGLWRRLAGRWAAGRPVGGTQ